MKMQTYIIAVLAICLGLMGWAFNMEHTSRIKTEASLETTIKDGTKALAQKDTQIASLRSGLDTAMTSVKRWEAVMAVKDSVAKRHLDALPKVKRTSDSVVVVNEAPYTVDPVVARTLAQLDSVAEDFRTYRVAAMNEHSADSIALDKAVRLAGAEREEKELMRSLWLASSEALAIERSKPNYTEAIKKAGKVGGSLAVIGGAVLVVVKLLR